MPESKDPENARAGNADARHFYESGSQVMGRNSLSQHSYFILLRGPSLGASASTQDDTTEINTNYSERSAESLPQRDGSDPSSRHSSG